MAGGLRDGGLPTPAGSVGSTSVADRANDKKPKVSPEWAAQNIGYDAPCPHGCPGLVCPHRRSQCFLPTDGPDSAVAKDGLDGKEANLGFGHRLFNAYFGPEEQAEEEASTSNRRGLPAPFSAPPFPFAEHIGPIVGLKDESVWPLMEAIYNGPSGNWFKDKRIKVYGWVDPSLNFSTSRKSNVPVSYDIYADKLELSQAIVIFERQTDSSQKDYCDWGFKWTNLYGIDYRYTTAKGYFSDQLLKHNHLYGYDPLQLYADFYIPWVAEGMIIRAGRYISPIDIEAQLSPENYLYTHSTMWDPLESTCRHASLSIL